MDERELPPAPVQRRSAKKRERILQAALMLFGERGYDGASLDEIAARAGVAVGSIYLHFRSKRQLLQVLMDELLRRLAGIDVTLEPGPDPEAAIRELLDRALSSDLAYAGAYRAWTEAVRNDAELAATHGRIRAWTLSRVHGAFESLQRWPRARAGVDVGALARLMDAFFWSQLADLASASPEKVDEFLDTTSQLIHHALFTDAPD